MRLHMKSSAFIISVTISISTLILWGCANQQPPEGGPVDLSPPLIISTYPDSSSQYNFKDNKLKFEFDRYVDERTFEESIFISPYVGGLEFNWSGSEVEITFSGKLRQHTTYVINIGTDVTDKYRGRTRMAKAYTMAFSTGSEIDRGGIEGVVFPMKKSDELSGVMIFGFQLDALKPDTLNPATSQPDFITQTGKGGAFFLHHIPFGNYRIFAVRDEYRNLVYDREVDEYGVPSQNISITQKDTLVSGILMQLAKEDRTGPRLVKASAPDQHHVLVEFSESLLPSSVTPVSLKVLDTLSHKQLDLVTVYPNPLLQKSVVLVTQKQDSATGYIVSGSSITDSVGNPIHPLANSFAFEGSPKADTVSPWLFSVSLKDSTLNVNLRPVMTLIFSDALAKKSPLDFVDIYDSDKQQVPVEKKWISDAMISLQPLQELSGKTWYTLRADLREVHDWKDKPCKDSIKVWRFETLDIEDMSSIEGTVVDSSVTDTEGRVYVTAVQIGERDSESYTVPTDATGHFIFPVVAEGSYVFQAFRDRNKNGKYDSGTPFPFVFSERLSQRSDTLKVRARWPLEGVKILLKE
jgi:hypothetical protein